MRVQAVEKALAVILSGGQPRQTDLHIEVVEEWIEEEVEDEDLQGEAPPPGEVANVDDMLDILPEMTEEEMAMELGF